MNIQLKGKLRLLLSALLLVFASGASAVTFDLDREFSGATPPSGPDPWLTATFVDVVAGTVRLTMDSFGLVDSEFVREWLFNIDPALNLGAFELFLHSTSHILLPIE